MKNNICIALIFLLSTNCQGQSDKRIVNENRNTDSIDCNQRVYGTKKYIKDLPSYICIPGGFIIDDYVRTSDLDKDERNDFLAVKFNKKEDDQIDGDITYWNFYQRNEKDTTYTLRHTLTNIVPPFIKDISYQYLAEHPNAEELFDNYPRRLAHKLSFGLIGDTIRLSYKFDDTYGKSFVFIYNALKTNWYLVNVEYFIGELPIHWWKESEFYYPLSDALMVIETRKPNLNVSIDKFDLKQAFKYGEEESTHLAEWHINNLDESLAASILKITFRKCKGIDLPDDWVY